MSAPTIAKGRTWIDGETVTPARLNTHVDSATLNFTQTDVLAGRSTAGAGLAEEIACTAAGRALIDDASATAQRATLGVHDYFQANNSVLTYAASVAVDFSTAVLTTQTITLTGNLALTSSNLASARSKFLRLVGDSSSRTLAFPAGWKFQNNAAPSSLLANKSAALLLIAFGGTDADVLAWYSVEP